MKVFFCHHDVDGKGVLIHPFQAVADVGVQKKEAAFPDVNGRIVYRLTDVSLPDIGEFEKVVAVDRTVYKAWVLGVSDPVSCREIILFAEGLPHALIKLVINDPELLRDQRTVGLSVFEGCFFKGRISFEFLDQFIWIVYGSVTSCSACIGRFPEALHRLWANTRGFDPGCLVWTLSF